MNYYQEQSYFLSGDFINPKNMILASHLLDNKLFGEYLERLRRSSTTGRISGEFGNRVVFAEASRFCYVPQVEVRDEQGDLELLLDAVNHGTFGVLSVYSRHPERAKIFLERIFTAKEFRASGLR